VRWAVLLLALGCGSGGEEPEEAAPVPPAVAVPSPPPPAPSPPPETPWLKGNLHTHTANSPDSGTRPEEVVRWYEEHGYDFVVLTDHNFVTEAHGDKLLVIPGAELTHRTHVCDPPPPDPTQDCRIHMNALFVGEHRGRVHWRADDLLRRVDKYQRAIDAARELGAIAQINHPNWHWGVSGELIAELGRRGALLLEIHNQQFTVFDRGRPGKHPSTEELWDAALSAGVTMWGVAVDDAHNYWEVPGRIARGEDPGYPAGGAFVMVHAERDVAAIRHAIETGDFYASTGVLLERAGRDGADYAIAATGGTPPYTFVFIGDGGRRLGTVTDAHQARLPMAEARGYLRVDVSDAHHQRAWTEPMRIP
jgi:hypothetical protein